MEKNKNLQIGLTYGLIIGLIYCILVFIRWSLSGNLILFGIMSFISYLVILAIMFVEAFQRRKLENGFIDLKNLFQTLFISVLVFELFFALYNFIHLKYIDPNVVDKMKEGMNTMLDKMSNGQITDSQREESLKRFDEMKKATEFVQVAKSYLISIAISGFFAFIIALIMRKKNPREVGMPQSL